MERERGRGVCSEFDSQSDHVTARGEAPAVLCARWSLTQAHPMAGSTRKGQLGQSGSAQDVYDNCQSLLPLAHRPA